MILPSRLLSKAEVAEYLGVSKKVIDRYVRSRQLPFIQHGSKGYILIKKPDHPYADQQGYVPEHRLVMEKKMGRYLRPEEIPHHINEDRADNREENLALFPSIAAHVSFHKKKRGKI